MIVSSFLKGRLTKKNDKVKFDIIPRTNEDYFSIKYVCKKFIDSYGFSSSSLDRLFKTLVDKNHKNP